MFSVGIPLASFVAAFLIAAGATPVFAGLARALGVVAPPRPDRWGGRPTPLLGGVALVLATLVPVGLLVGDDRRWLLLAGGTVAAFVLGLVDDVRGLRPTSKLVGQVAIASGLALGGVRVEMVDFAPVSFMLTLFWIVAIMNALNLVDNMDGLAAGVAAIAAGVLVLMAPVEPLWIRTLAAALAGSCIGFLVHNFAPARVYMGDAGSLALGFLLGALALVQTNAAAADVALAILGPLLVLAFPIFDTTLVSVMRRLEGQPVSQGGRDHASHRLAARGLSDRATVLALYAVAASVASLALLSQAVGFAMLPLAGLAVVGLVLFGAFLVEDPTGTTVAGSSREALVGRGQVVLRYGGEIGIDVALAVIALFSAFLIRFEALPTSAWLALFLQAAPFVVSAQLACFVLLGVYRTLWSFVGVTDLVAIAKAAFVGALVAGFVMLYVLGMTGQSRAVLLLDAVLVTLLVASSRLFLASLRHWFALRPHEDDRRVLIVGATPVGEMALRLLLRAEKPSFHPAGFLDDDPGKHRRTIAGVPVLGNIAQLQEVALRERADLVILALNDQGKREVVRRLCAELGIEAREFSGSLT